MGYTIFSMQQKNAATLYGILETDEWFQYARYTFLQSDTPFIGVVPERLLETSKGR